MIGFAILIIIAGYKYPPLLQIDDIGFYYIIACGFIILLMAVKQLSNSEVTKIEKL